MGDFRSPTMADLTADLSAVNGEACRSAVTAVQLIWLFLCLACLALDWIFDD
jgi:hypothetical protein